MTFKAKGILTAIGEKKTTLTGVAVQNFHFEQENGKVIYPSCLGKKVDLIGGFLPGDVVEVEFFLSGSKGHYNNVIVDNITRV